MNSIGTTRAGGARAARKNGLSEIQQGHYTLGDVISQFRAAMQDAGITPPDAIIADGEINRFHIAGDKHGTLNGAYTLHLDGRPAGYFEDLKRGIKCTWKQSGPFMPLTDFQRQAFAKQHQAFAKQRQADEIQRQAEEAAKHKKAASKAVYIWNHAPPAPANHPYLIKKRIDTHRARLGRDNMLVIPLYDENGVLTSLQFVNEDGAKRLLKDGRVQGSFSPVVNCSRAAQS